MADKPVTITKDTVKERLRVLRNKPALTPQETKEMLDKLFELMER